MAVRVRRAVRLWVLKAWVAVWRIEDISESEWHFVWRIMDPSMGEMVLMRLLSWVDMVSGNDRS